MTAIGTVSLEEVVGSIDSLFKISGKVIHPQAAFYFAKLNKLIKPALTEYNNEMNLMFSKNAETNPKNGKLEIVHPDKMEAFKKEQEDYMRSRFIDLHDTEKIPFNLMMDIEQSCFNALLWCIQ